MNIPVWLATSVVIAIAAAASASAASLNRTSDGYTYFNKPGADLKAHEADVAFCRRLTQPTVQPGWAAAEAATDLYSSTGFWERMENAKPALNRVGRQVNLENCMVARGWRVVALEPAEGEALAARGRASRMAVLSPWIGADAPRGAVVRVFGNDALQTATPAFAQADPAGRSLDVEPEPPPTPQLVQLDPDDPSANTTAPVTIHRLKPLRPDQIRPPSSDTGLIVVGLAGAGSFRLVFERIDRQGLPASDGEVAEFTLAQAQGGAEAADPMRVYAVPAGHWRIAAMAQGPYLVNFCLGAPDFYLAPGQVIYAGAFDPSASSRAPAMDLAAGKAALPQGSRLAEALRPADWRNGSVGRCRGAYLYALEFPGRPFAETYRMGSMARTGAP